MPNYKLVYFNGKGRAELIRLVLTYAGEKFEDSRVDHSQWGTLKPNTPWGSVPYLEVDGKQLAQSNTIARFLARKHGLAGSNEWEQALIESALDSTEDIFTHVSRVFRADASKKDEEAKKLREEELPKILANFDKYASKNGHNGYLVGNKLTLADLALYNIIDQLITHKHLSQEDLEKYPKTKEIFNKVQSDSKLEHYIKNRPQTPF